MKKYTIWLVRAGMAAIAGWYLLMMGCNTPLVKNFGKAPSVNFPDVAADLVYGYKIIHVGDAFPDIALKSPGQPSDRSYLGLAGDKKFTISDIKADLVLVEMLNTHCQPCVEAVPVYNNLFRRLEAGGPSVSRIKMLAVGVGNTDAEIKSFREKYEIPFPIVADSRFELHDAVGQPRLPFSILVRLDEKSNEVIVALTYSEVSTDYERIYQDMTALATLDPSVFRERGLKEKAPVYKVAPLFPASEIAAKIKSAMIKVSPGEAHLTEFKKIALDGYQVYTAVSKTDKGFTRLFAEVISRPSICSVCHDVYFFYIFNEKGVVLDFVPLQVTKWGNKDWSKEDVQTMRERLDGRLINTPFYFNPQLDAVTSATITSAIIFDELSRGNKLFELLKQKGFITTGGKDS